MRSTSGNPTAALTSVTGEAMSLKSVQASGHVSGLLLELTVRQAYRNDTGKTLETVYTFPLAWGAVLMGLNVEIAGKRLSGVVVERKDAEQRYEEAVAEGDTPIMLEQSSDGLYTVNLGNLKPGEEAVIEYQYGQLLHYEQSRIRIAVPTTIAPRYGHAERQGGIRPHEAVESDLLAEYPLALTLTLVGDLASGAVQSPSHPIHTQCEDGRLVVSLAKAYLDRDFVLTVEGLEGRSMAEMAADGAECVVLASFCPRITGTPGRAIGLKILIDCSGSMAGDSIGAAKKALHQVLAELDPADNFSYSRFGSSVVHAFQEMVPADQHHLRLAAMHVERTDADMGGTEIEDALRSVFALDGTSEGANVLLITDGEVWNIEGVAKAAQQSGHRIFAVGVGSAPAETLLRRLANNTGGACELVAPNEDIEAAVVRMFRRMRVPRASNVVVEWNGRPKWITPLPPTLFDGDTVHVFAGFDVPPEEPPVLSFQVAGNDVQRVAAPLPRKSERDVLARLAASERLVELPSSQRVELALRYQLVTSETSLFLVHLREDEDKADGLPHLQKIAHMQAAGWGGMGSVTGAPLMDMCVSSPAVMFSIGRRHSAADLAYSGFDDLDIPAFLRKSAEGDEEGGSTQAEWRTRLDLLLAIVNSRLDHPDDMPAMILDLEAGPADLHLLLPLVEAAQALAPTRVDAWVVLIAWADRQVEPAHRLTRHAARAIRSLLGTIPEGMLVAAMAGLDARMQQLSADGWMPKPHQEPSRDEAPPDGVPSKQAASPVHVSTELLAAIKQMNGEV